MFSTDNGHPKEEVKEASNAKETGPASLDVSASGNQLIIKQKSLPIFDAAFVNRITFLKFGSASARFKQIANNKDQISQSVMSSSSHGIRGRFTGVFSQKLDWKSLSKLGKEWIRNPMNMALLVWIIGVGVSGAILFLVMTGMLNGAIKKKSQRNDWFEINNQILNALFTLMCLYQHPKRIHQLVMLCRWKPGDITRMRKIYCKNGTYKPHEWGHMMVVVILLHINCFAQYSLCGLNLGYRRSNRPAIGVGLTVSVAIASPAIAGLYTILSPLGKDYDDESDEESQKPISTPQRSEQFRRKSWEKRYSFASYDVEGQVENTPRWSGGIFDFWNDISLAFLSLFCSCCLFGWNMERLGFGNMYVHIATFLLFCMAPFWIFTLAAVNIDNEGVREFLGITGVVLCVFGLLYGGFWRIQMRKRFNLPPYLFCLSRPSVADCTLWLCCCWCSLAQEVRTGNSYDIVENKFYRKKQIDSDHQTPISPLPREGGEISMSSPSSSMMSVMLSSPQNPSKFPKQYQSPEKPLAPVKEGPSDVTMIPPAVSAIDREAS